VFTHGCDLSECGRGEIEGLATENQCIFSIFGHVEVLAV
jgi:hypothetical protein